MRRRKPPSQNSNTIKNDAKDEDDTENVSLVDIYPTCIKNNTTTNNINNENNIISANDNITTVSATTSNNTKDSEIGSYGQSTSIVASTPADLSHLKSTWTSDFSTSYTPPPLNELGMSCIRHITYFDGCELSPLTAFNKMWRLRNSGSSSWPAGCCLSQCGGDVLSVDSSQKIQMVPQLPPGQEYSLSISLIGSLVMVFANNVCE